MSGLLLLGRYLCSLPLMPLSKEDMEEFRAIYHEETGTYLSDAEVSEMAHRLINLYMLLSKKLPSEQDITPSESHPEM